MYTRYRPREALLGAGVTSKSPARLPGGAPRPQVGAAFPRTTSEYGLYRKARRGVPSRAGVYLIDEPKEEK